MKRLALNILLAGLLAASAHAQFSSAQPVGQTIKNFSMPQTDSNGTITSMTTGDEAKVISANRTQITNMKIELYESGDVTTTILSPRADLWKSINKLRTREGVIIKRPKMEITAQTMDWETTERRGILRQNVRVVLQDFSMNQPIGGTTPPATSTSSPPASTPAPSSPAPAPGTPQSQDLKLPEKQ